jgi:hypothetical protein
VAAVRRRAEQGVVVAGHFAATVPPGQCKAQGPAPDAGAKVVQWPRQILSSTLKIPC